jgi:hypothetical protein
VAGLVIAGFLILRAVLELFAIDWSDHAGSQHDWGGPSLAGVLAVHVLPCVLAAVAVVIVVVRRRRASGSAAT